MSEAREDRASSEQSPTEKKLGKLNAIFKILQSAIESLGKPLAEDHPYLVELRNTYRSAQTIMERPIRYGASDPDPGHSISLGECHQAEKLAQKIAALIATCTPTAIPATTRTGILGVLGHDIRILSPAAEGVQRQSACDAGFSVIQNPTLATQAMQTAQQNDGEKKK